ncbi:MAG: Translation initiation factor IF-1 [Candidatus Wolfebacteria bacterium GW2011_GWC1_43_10]|uniref:Translation initiation factor IF-1 n=2 Tax=Candidatus Wolfeibacteriota TaxID=1752735 RepID=A0A0G1F4B9_9BACT|nr:MAG: Translation initiation factor IF-1 [Candidatus Wolfebacteria bacterium GW2011_GWC1_43_10]KKT22946.1 MAG: Translation initiation factor IF-1 [Parcubacteria group bacterium GW2011_GWB1_43_8b]OGM89904.1 MAG: hypothetical protein A2108_02885 [Candidatus Wolfebacteria bacterium GWA1_42_9]
MSDQEKANTLEGRVVEALPSATFRVETFQGIILCHLAGKMRIHHIKVMPGDRVLLKLGPDGKRGIVTRRL